MEMASACYVYAIQPLGARLPTGCTGFDGSPLEALVEGALVAVISRVGGTGPLPTTDTILRHEAIIEAARASGPALPVRFGTVFPDADAVRHAIAQRAPVLVNDLARIGTKVEVGGLVLWPPSMTPNPVGVEQMERTAPPQVDAGVHVHGQGQGEGRDQGRGTRYLLVRRETYQKQAGSVELARTLVTEMTTQLDGCVCESHYTIHTTPRLAVRASYLVDTERVATCRKLLEAVAGSHPGLHVLVTGPWPPYSFVTRT